jgi:hypothetical protein
LTGVNVDYRDNGFYMAACDGDKVVERTIPVDGTGKPTTFIVPGRTMATLAKILPDEAIVNISRTDTQVFFNWDNASVVSSLIEGTYPNYGSVVPTKFDATGTVDLDRLHKALKQHKTDEQITITVKPTEIARFTDSEFILAANGTVANLDCETDNGFTAKFDTKQLTGIVNEVIKANPRSKVTGYTAKGKPTMRADKSPRSISFAWNETSRIIVLTYNGTQNTLIAVRPEPVSPKPMTYNPARDNDYTGTGDTNDYTAEQNRYRSPIGEKPMTLYLLPATTSETKTERRHNLKLIAELQRRGAVGPNRIESSGVIALAASYTEPVDPTGWYRRSLRQAAQSSEIVYTCEEPPNNCAVCGREVHVNPVHEYGYIYHVDCWRKRVQRDKEIRERATKPSTCAICEQVIDSNPVRQNGHTLHAECYSRMEAYNQRVEARYTRLLNAATKHEAESDRLHKYTNQVYGALNGQPILVGHHSEKRHRNLLDRLWAMDGKAYQHYKTAEDLKRRAEASRKNRAISSDDPAALVKLKEKLADLEHKQTEYKRVNAAVRKMEKYPREAEYKRIVEQAARANPGDPINEQFKQIQAERKQWLNTLTEKAPELAKLIGMGESTAKNLLTPDFMGRIGIPDYVTRNNGAEIRRLKQRIENMTKLRTKQATEDNTETQYGDITVIRNIEANRLQIVFPGKPSKAIIAELKARSFHWSRNEGAWQRMLSNGAEFAAECVLRSAGVSIPSK